jgi:hypothetical protein
VTCHDPLDWSCPGCKAGARDLRRRALEAMAGVARGRSIVVVWHYGPRIDVVADIRDALHLGLFTTDVEGHGVIAQMCEASRRVGGHWPSVNMVRDALRLARGEP